MVSDKTKNVAALIFGIVGAAGLGTGLAGRFGAIEAVTKLGVLANNITVFIGAGVLLVAIAAAVHTHYNPTPDTSVDGPDASCGNNNGRGGCAA